jgi:hypothetical protein
VADNGHRLALLEEPRDEPDGVLVGAQGVRVGHATGEHERVVLARVRFRDLTVDAERVGLVQMVEALNLSRLERDELGLPARFLDRLPRLGQLDLLYPVGREEGDPLAV